jgi:hypothetical protein
VNGATDTRTIAAPVIGALKGKVVKERYTDGSSNGINVGSLGRHPEVLDCKCYVVISSYMEERYRLEAQRYPREAAVYDQLRRRGRVVAVISPSRPLSYRWDVLPAFGEGRVPLTGSIGPLGPIITVLDLGGDGSQSAR